MGEQVIFECRFVVSSIPIEKMSSLSLNADLLFQLKFNRKISFYIFTDGAVA